MFIALKIPAMTHNSLNLGHITCLGESHQMWKFCSWSLDSLSLFLWHAVIPTPFLRPFLFTTSSFLSFHLSLHLALHFWRYQVALYTSSLGVFCFFQSLRLLLNQNYVRCHLKSQTCEEKFFAFPDSLGRVETGNKIIINKLKLSGISH